MRWDPDKRLKPEQALAHEFLTGVKPRQTQPTSRPLPRGPFAAATTVNATSASPAKRYNTGPSQTPQRARDASSASRPLPEPPAPSFRAAANHGSPVKGSPIKSAGTGPKRHATVSGAPMGTPAALIPGQGKRVLTVNGPQGRRGPGNGGNGSASSQAAQAAQAAVGTVGAGR